jgi:hypothetical protein
VWVRLLAHAGKQSVAVAGFFNGSKAGRFGEGSRQSFGLVDSCRGDDQRVEHWLGWNDFKVVALVYEAIEIGIDEFIGRWKSGRAGELCILLVYLDGVVVGFKFANGGIVVSLSAAWGRTWYAGS